MSLFFSYLLNSFLYRFTEFFRRWYFGSFKICVHFLVSVLEKLDRRFAIKITWRHFFEPLYQDRTVVGYVLGFVFRSGRLIIGAAIYAVIILIGAFFYLLWLLIPPYVILKIIGLL